MYVYILLLHERLYNMQSYYVYKNPIHRQLLISYLTSDIKTWMTKNSKIQY